MKQPILQERGLPEKRNNLKLTKLNFSTKARTLQSLHGILQAGRILPQVFFPVRHWRDDPKKKEKEILRALGSGPWIVRSSCAREDGAAASHAGVFLSVPSVSGPQLAQAIQKVVNSYGEDSDGDEVLIQPMLQNVVRSGVAFSHDPTTCTPYRIVSWSEGPDTSRVTGGQGGQTWQQAAQSSYPPPSALQRVFPLLEELYERFGKIPLDIEFAVTQEIGDEVIWLLQARPLVLSETPEEPAVQKERLEILEKKLRAGMKTHPFLIGQRSVYGVMPDWNPAEIIGLRPKPLALSLYREMITDSIWAYQRDNYGYRNLRSFPLMPHFFGLPYIDVRLSFNSFIPADLPSALAGRLVDYYTDRLLEEPSLHDKVEFEIVFSCYTLDLPDRLKSLDTKDFSKNEKQQIKESLRRLTNKILHPEQGLWKEDERRINRLLERRKELFASKPDPLEAIYWLLEDGKRYGTLPFAGLARAAFIAVQMLKSLVKIRVFTQGDYDAFLESLKTVSSDLAKDKEQLSKKAFLAKYGHLRPGTYDILSDRYDENPDLYFQWSDKKVKKSRLKSAFIPTLMQMQKVEALLKKHRLEPDPVAFFDFLKKAIQLREWSKFQFTKNISDVLALIGKIGIFHGFSREEMAFSEIHAFKELHITTDFPRERLAASIASGKKNYRTTCRLALPPLLSRPEEIWGFQWPETSPNFITQKSVIGEIAEHKYKKNLTDKIVCIPSADPGYDWIFSHHPSGLITAWGGANSHMAIRAGELGLPAVIGAGETNYLKWATAKKVLLDAGNKKVEVLS